MLNQYPACLRHLVIAPAALTPYGPTEIERASAADDRLVGGCSPDTAEETPLRCAWNSPRRPAAPLPAVRGEVLLTQTVPAVWGWFPAIYAVFTPKFRNLSWKNF
jgi:hypothetical protein